MFAIIVDVLGVHARRQATNLLLLSAALFVGGAGCGRGAETPSRPAGGELGVASGVSRSGDLASSEPQAPTDPEGVTAGAGPGASAAEAPGDGGGEGDGAASEPVTADKPLIITVVVGSFADDLREAVEVGLRESLPVEVRQGPTWALPKAAYYPPRRRYRADTLIDLLSDAAREDAEHPEVRYLGLTSVDISTTKDGHKDWGIFGLAFSPGRGAVISSHRLKKGAKGRDHFAFRVTNTAIHEVGHSLGLAHCDEARCPMQDAEGSIATTDSSDQVLGPECAAKLADERR